MKLRCQSLLGNILDAPTVDSSDSSSFSSFQYGHGSNKSVPPVNIPIPTRLKWVAHLPQNGIPLVLIHSHRRHQRCPSGSLHGRPAVRRRLGRCGLQLHRVRRPGTFVSVGRGACNTSLQMHICAMVKRHLYLGLTGMAI